MRLQSPVRHCVSLGSPRRFTEKPGDDIGFLATKWVTLAELFYYIDIDDIENRVTEFEAALAEARAEALEAAKVEAAARAARARAEAEADQADAAA